MIEKNKIEIKRIIKYLFSAGTSFFIDLLLFTIFNTFLFKSFGSVSIIVSTVLARILSSFYNYFLNSRYVFKSYDKTSIIKYYLLVIVQMLVSATLVLIVSKLLTSVNDTIIKFFIDIIIFVVNYYVQKEVIFK